MTAPVKKDPLAENDRKKLRELNNPRLTAIVEEVILLCRPEKVTVLTGCPEDMDYVREMALRRGEETPLAIPGHSVHFDGYHDQARDMANTRILVAPGESMGGGINAFDREKGLAEIRALMEGIMAGKEMLVCFYDLGPINSRFSIPSLQITDSFYVAHCENLLYRQGYGEFRRRNGKGEFFHFIHSAGALDERGNSKSLHCRRTFIDLQEKRVFTINNQYAGSSVGLKKPAFRLSIHQSLSRDWMCEHMFISGVFRPTKKRVTYFTGAFPSASGKTSTAMIPGHTIVGDDLAFIGPGSDGRAWAANVEQGIFGIIEDINAVDDPLLWQVLTTPREIIFSNVLVKDGVPYWSNMGREIPQRGVNHSGPWFQGKRDGEGREIPFSSKNSRYTLRISELENADPCANDPAGVPLGGIIFGGRDADISVPVLEALNWAHGVYCGATIESETTAATIGRQGVLKHNPMAIIEFLSVPLGAYLRKYLQFGAALRRPPRIFRTNYFLRDKGEFLNGKLDKKVWLWWMEGRVHNELKAIRTPIGWIPRHEDLRILFRDALNKDYRMADYEKQFTLRIDRLLERIGRMEAVFTAEHSVPRGFFREMEREKRELEAARKDFGEGSLSPLVFA
ncbi:MAG: phosphoenolpyruvate carboxykinase (GTP) [Deltaproteobacteria bacterium]|nr:phosphoenolpyruvate carboxykinase (GTP) [Deltaproteobacteria bacterium]